MQQWFYLRKRCYLFIRNVILNWGGLEEQMLGDFIDNKEFFGNAFRLFEEANSFIMRHLPIASFFESDSLERIDKPALPVLAVREALVNAICHRDYSNRSSSITLAIFDDRMEI